jgi:hypothetical protein
MIPEVGFIDKTLGPELLFHRPDKHLIAKIKEIFSGDYQLTNNFSHIMGQLLGKLVY